MIAGRATLAGTERYVKRFATDVPDEHYRRFAPLGALSSLGLGTYLGREDDATDGLYRRAIGRALERGVNVVDTAINYRHQRSERAIGAVLQDLVGRGALAREEIVITTKGGYVAFDGEVPADPRGYFMETYVRPGVISPGDIVGGAHCMTPRYLADQIQRSRRNLGLATLDVYYLHNPEQQLAEVDRATFLARVRDAFVALEQAVREGLIGCYGTATWNGYRQPPDGGDHLSLEELVQAARDVAGPDHHFKVIQLPYNLAMPEAFTRASQRVGSDTVPTLEAARRLDVYVMASASVYQGQLTRSLPPAIADFLPGLDSDAQRALQFVRSTPGIGTALVGMKTVAHVEENVALSRRPPIAWTSFQKLFKEA